MGGEGGRRGGGQSEWRGEVSEGDSKGEKKTRHVREGRYRGRERIYLDEHYPFVVSGLI